MTIGGTKMSAFSAIIWNAQKVVSLTLGSGRTSMPYTDPEKARENARKRARTHYEANKSVILERQRQKRLAPETGDALRKRERERKAADPERQRANFRAWYAKNPRSREKTIEQHLATRHGMRPEDRDAMREGQGGRCCYCERPLPENSRQVHIDHDHSCTCGPKKSCQYCRRGLACEACNTIIGKLGEDWDRMDRIVANGRRLQAEARARINSKPVQAELFVINEAASRRKEVS
jgi:Recombination endonuclease VII